MILDVDGVILPLDETWLAAARELIAALGIRVGNEELLLEMNSKGGSNLAAAIVRIYRRRGGTAQQQEIDSLLAERVSAKGIQLDRVSWGLARAVRHLGGSDVILGIVSSRLKSEIYDILDRLSIKEFIEVAVGRDDVDKGRMKPAPDQLKMASSLAEIQSGACVYLGDTVDDLVAARRAEMDCVWVSPVDIPSSVVKRVAAITSTRIHRRQLPAWLIFNSRRPIST